MGLDISAFSNATPTDSGDAYQVYVTDGVPNLLDGKPEGMYEGTDTFGFRAGSYGGYNSWRSWLSRTFLGVLPESVWDNPAQFSGKPFVELIHFSDCEGAIGPTVSAKLFHDFEANESQLNGADQWYVDVYHKWKRAFEIASKDGFVIFH